MKQPMVKVRQMANMYDIKIGVRGGGAGTPPLGALRTQGGGSFNITIACISLPQAIYSL